MGIDFDDTSPENANAVYALGKQVFMSNHDAGLIYNINGKLIDLGAFEHDGEYRKYKWILSHININESTRVLELGFGNLAFMKYGHRATEHDGSKQFFETLVDEHRPSKRHCVTRVLQRIARCTLFTRNGLQFVFVDSSFRAKPHG